MKFAEYKQFNLSQINKDIYNIWKNENTFQQSLDARQGAPDYIFYEGPPSANGMPGIHHVLARTIKDTFCRYKVNKGYNVNRKAGWDTHGLPVELGVEKLLNITKEDIGKTISVEDYNAKCKSEVMRYTKEWENITELMGYWVDMKNPYVTYTSDYIETIWWLLKQLYNKKLIYKGYTIQPYSPAAGTGLSSHELNLPGCYVNVKDTTAVVLFKTIKNSKTEFLFNLSDTDIYFMAWTTTPWTLLSNTALAVGEAINYVLVKTWNPYTHNPITVILAEDLLYTHFSEKNKDLVYNDYQAGSKNIPYQVLATFTGKQLNEIRYEQLLPYVQPETGDAFRVVVGDFVTTTDGTGIVHIAPSFGADDFKVANQNGIGALTLVDKTGFFVDGLGEFSRRPVKKVYDVTLPENTEEVDVDIVVKLKKEGKLFKSEKYEHSYPHCWRTSKPILYYPLDSWFIKTTEYKERMMELNKTINWQPPATGSGRFGQWLENLIDWNLSRSRYWGTPLPIWRTADGTEEICIGSFEELKTEIEKAVNAGIMKHNPMANFVPGNFSKENYASFEPHKPFVDDIVLLSSKGEPMYRESDLIDVWFDSGAMPYAQLHYPFENKELFTKNFPADFIAEGVDQTRGWFFTLHAIASMVFDSVAFKNLVSTGLVLDKFGNKMSKSKGNVVNPFDTIEKYGTDPVRWYMMTNASPWENLKFDFEGIEEVRRKFFGTLYNTYSFFALYANIDNFNYSESEIPVSERPEIDRWIISLLNTLVKDTDLYYASYDVTKAGRAIQTFVTENLSNWYVRLNRKRFWGGEYNTDKISAYQTLYTCIKTVAQLMAPIAPFYSEQLFRDLNTVTQKINEHSVHIAFFPEFDQSNINKDLELRMEMAQQISSMVLALRKKANIKVRQPLQKIMIPVLSPDFEQIIEKVKNIILTEINVKEIEFIYDASGVLVKKVKPDFKQLGKKLGKHMKHVSSVLSALTQPEIAAFEQEGTLKIQAADEVIELYVNEVEITSEDIPGWLVATENKITVALDINISITLKEEGIAREFINRIQNLRKELGFDVTDKIELLIQEHPEINSAVNNFKNFIGAQTLAQSVSLYKDIDNQSGIKFVEIDENISTAIFIKKV